jgi:hypothetical protein
MSRTQIGTVPVTKSMLHKSALFEDDKNISSFIGKLSMMLQDSTAQPYVCWSQSGESILIIDPPRFSSQILPRLEFWFVLVILGKALIFWSLQILQTFELCFFRSAAQFVWIPQNFSGIGFM